MSSSRSHRPRRSLGQNFLVDGNLRRRIVEEAAIEPHDTVLEIGPGQGALTDLLAERAGRLVLVELDRDLAADLRHRFQGHRSVEVVEGDILELALVDMVDAPESVRVVGNIPYNITTPILFHLLSPPRPADILLMVQKEVADRILAEPGTGAFGALTVGVQAVADVERVLSVPPSAFRPRPRVDSTVIRIRPRRPAPMSPAEEDALRILTRALFQWRRKQLRKTLGSHPDLHLPPAQVAALLAAAGAEPTDRPETVAPEGFVAMARLLDFP
ncbi:MAG: ribosomal RNA small subunit methyltransferase A [Gemmatimonadales bacterium]|nr:MAG: ribosomal RNA small subunit methyltransferase A [Gemmatimonadales bacterium]